MATIETFTDAGVGDAPIASDGRLMAIRIEPDLIGGVLDVPYWEIWEAETYETVSAEPIADEPGLSAEVVLERWRREEAR